MRARIPKLPPSSRQRCRSSTFYTSNRLRSGHHRCVVDIFRTRASRHDRVYTTYRKYGRTADVAPVVSPSVMGTRPRRVFAVSVPYCSVRRQLIDGRPPAPFVWTTLSSRGVVQILIVVGSELVRNCISYNSTYKYDAFLGFNYGKMI